MKCPFELPAEKYEPMTILRDAEMNYLCDYADDDVADYILQAINSHKKLVRVIKETNQCFKCKFGYRQQTLTCPDGADAELPCAGFVEEHKGLNYLEQVLEETEKL